MTIQQIQAKYNCTYANAVNIFSKLNTPEQLGLTAVVTPKTPRTNE